MTLLVWATSEMGIETLEDTEPTMAFTLSWLITLVAALTPSVASFLSSATTVVIWTLPALLASSTAMSKAFLVDSPKVLTSPVIGAIKPILTAIPLAAAAG